MALEDQTALRGGRDRDEQLIAQRDANERLLVALVRQEERAERAERESEASRAREDLLLEVAEFRERLIGIVGHDLRNPLNAVLMAATLLIQGKRLMPGDERLATRIVDASERMKRIIIQVLEYTRARLGGGFALDLTRTDLGDICRRIRSELALASGREIRFEQRGDVSGTWDGELLGEVLSNVLGNAIEHASPGTPVEIDLDEHDGMVVASVTNEGPPISAEILAHLFEPFRGGSSGHHSGNLGLGLYIAHEIVGAHGGRIEVGSTEQRTTFAIFLPRAPAALPS